MANIFCLSPYPTGLDIAPSLRYPASKPLPHWGASKIAGEKRMRASSERLRKKQRDLGYTQQELFGVNSKLRDEGKTRPKKNWYYITGALGKLMLASLDDNGYPVWVEHDLRITKPHLYNSIHKANHARRHWKRCGVILYPHSPGK